MYEDENTIEALSVFSTMDDIGCTATTSPDGDGFFVGLDGAGVQRTFHVAEVESVATT